MRYWIFSILLFSLANLSFAQEDPNCAGAPVPQLEVGGYGQVTEGDANNVRDIASRDGTKIGEIPALASFSVLEGPVCADGFNWWRVDYDGLVGWTVEGAGTDYFVLPIAAPAPTATAEPPVPLIVYPLSADNALAVGLQARVDIAGLNIRANPSRSAAMLSQTVENEIVEIVGGSTEAEGFTWWQIQQTDGTVGWVVERFREPQKPYYQTLFPLCPYTTERLSFIVHPYLYTSARDGSQRCVLAELHTASGYSTWTNLKYMVNDAFWSPQGDALIYMDSIPSVGDKLYSVSVDGAQRLLLTPNNSMDWAVWSPDGSRIALVMSGQAWVMNRDGTNPVRLSDTTNAIEYIGWLPDGQNVLYVETIPENPNAVQTLTRTEVIVHQVGIDLSSPSVLLRLDGDIEIRDAELSPDGKNLILVLTEMDEFLEPIGGGAYLYNTESWERVLLDAYWDYEWAPDGQFLFTSMAENQILNLVTGESRSTGEFVADTWSLDGQFLYTTEGAGFSKYEIATGEITNYLEEEAADLEPEEGGINFMRDVRNVREQPNN